MTHRILVVMVLGVLAGCADTPAPETFPDDFGVAVRTNMQAQIIRKDGEVTALAPAPGERRSLAVGRYQTDQVEPPVKIFTRGE